MLDTIQTFLDKHLGAAGHAVQGDDERALQLAIATLLMEVARADHHVSDAHAEYIAALEFSEKAHDLFFWSIFFQ